MADHVRKQIRDAAAAALGNLATTGSHCFTSRMRLLQDSELPALRVYVNSEASRISAKGGGAANVELERMAELVVEGCCKASDEAALDDTFDTIAKEVEVALAGGLVPARILTLGSVEIEIEGGGDAARAVIRMTFNALYYTTVGAPDVAL